MSFKNIIKEDIGKLADKLTHSNDIDIEITLSRDVINEIIVKRPDWHTHGVHILKLIPRQDNIIYIDGIIYEIWMISKILYTIDLRYHYVTLSLNNYYSYALELYSRISPNEYCVYDTIRESRKKAIVTTCGLIRDIALISTVYIFALLGFCGSIYVIYLLITS